MSDDSGSATSLGNPEIKIAGETMHFAKVIYDNLDVEAEEAPGIVTTTVKRVGGLKCSHYSTGGRGIGPRTSQHSCKLRANINAEEFRQLYQALRVAHISQLLSLGGRYVKAVGPLILVDHDESPVVFENEWCEFVNGQRSAKKCMQGWAEYVFPRFEAPNDIGVTGSRPKKQLLLSLIGRFLSRETIRKVNQANVHVSVMLQHSDEYELGYFYIDQGRYPMPLPLYTSSLADLPSDMGQDEDNFDFNPDELSLGLEPVRTNLRAAWEE